MTANIVEADSAAIETAARLLRGGGLVAFPTETVYGLGADARDDRAVARVFEAKSRPEFNPLIVHVRDFDAAAREVEFGGLAASLARHFWPGPLTLVLRRRAESRLSRLVSAGLDTLALRVPRHDVAEALLAAFGGPLAAPSANRSGAASPTTAAHVADSLGGAVDLILDGGACPVGLESTIVDLAGVIPSLLRPGGAAVEDIEARIGPLDRPAEDRASAPNSPGRLARHYAPRARLRLAAKDARPGEALLAFGPEPPSGAEIARNLSPTGDLVEAAANFFAMLRELDQSGAETIAVMTVPETGLGLAINDRLRRAAARE